MFKFLWAICFIIIGSAALNAVPANAQPDYKREYFGAGWADLDHDGCNTRVEVLERDMQDEVMQRCSIKSGSLIDPYQGTKLYYGIDSIEIDHVVSLADAWRSGAYAWTPLERVNFANDMTNLVATSRRNNRAKSDKTPDVWLPAVNKCQYVLQYNEVKLRYHLDITVEEQLEIDRHK